MCLCSSWGLLLMMVKGDTVNESGIDYEKVERDDMNFDDDNLKGKTLTWCSVGIQWRERQKPSLTDDQSRTPKNYTYHHAIQINESNKSLSQ